MTGVQTCALPIFGMLRGRRRGRADKKDRRGWLYCSGVASGGTANDDGIVHPNYARHFRTIVLISETLAEFRAPLADDHEGVQGFLQLNERALLVRRLLCMS